MADLESDHKVFVVQRLACFHTLAEVRDLLKEEWGVDADTAQLARYNPLCKAGQKLSAELKDEFTRTREAFLNDRAEIAISHQNFRLRELLDLYRAAKFKKNTVLAAQLLEQAAKEVGGVYVGHGSDPDIDKRIAEIAAFLVGKGQKETSG